jgi:hypothetical protein
MFSTDYPHRDFDPPTESLPSALPPETLLQIMSKTASGLYKLTIQRLQEPSGHRAGCGSPSARELKRPAEEQPNRHRAKASG